MDECRRNLEISELVAIWEWCSKRLHIRWQRRRKRRNAFLMGAAYAVTQPKPISPFEFVRIYTRFPRPLLDQKRIRAFWDVQPVTLLDACLGSFAVKSPLNAGLDELRTQFMTNAALDKVAKAVRAREKRFGSSWLFEGYHPESEFKLLRKGTQKLCSALRTYLVRNHRFVDQLTLEILARGGWQFGELPAQSLVRRTPPVLLNKTNRLKLWDAAHELISPGANCSDADLERLCTVLYRKITPALRCAIEAQGYTVDHVIDDFLNYDRYATREQIIAR